jgi:hypothetical protein
MQTAPVIHSSLDITASCPSYTKLFSSRLPTAAECDFDISFQPSKLIALTDSQCITTNGCDKVLIVDAKASNLGVENEDLETGQVIRTPVESFGCKEISTLHKAKIQSISCDKTSSANPILSVDSRGSVNIITFDSLTENRITSNIVCGITKSPTGWVGCALFIKICSVMSIISFILVE